MKCKIKYLVILLTLSFAAQADYDGSYEYSKENYPELTNILNKGNYEGEFSLVNIEMPNDGVFSFGKNGDAELFLVNYITFNNASINYHSMFVEMRSGKFSDSKIKVPQLRRIEHQGEVYSLHKQSTEAKGRALFVKYQFSCKYPSTFIQVGDCSNHEVYVTLLGYEIKDNEMVLTSTTINKI